MKAFKNLYENIRKKVNKIQNLSSHIYRESVCLENNASKVPYPRISF